MHCVLNKKENSKWFQDMKLNSKIAKLKTHLLLFSTQLEFNFYSNKETEHMQRKNVKFANESSWISYDLPH